MLISHNEMLYLTPLSQIWIHKTNNRDILTCNKPTNDRQSTTRFRVWIQQIKWNCRVIKPILKTRVCSTALCYMVRQSSHVENLSILIGSSFQCLTGCSYETFDNIRFSKLTVFPQVNLSVRFLEQMTTADNFSTYVHAKWRLLLYRRTVTC